MNCWAHSDVIPATLAPPMLAKTIGTNGGGMPPRNESCSMDCSIFLCSSRRPSCLVFSSSCFRRSSSDFAFSHDLMDSSWPDHCDGALGRVPRLMLLVGPLRSGWGWGSMRSIRSILSMVEGGGKPRWDVLIISVLGSGRELEEFGGER